MIRHANLKYTYGRSNFWVKKYFIDIVAQKEKAIKKYIKKSVEKSIMS